MITIVSEIQNCLPGVKEKLISHPVDCDNNLHSPSGDEPRFQHNGLRLGVVHWGQNDGNSTLISRASARLGCEVIDFLANQKLPPGLDVVFANGPFGSLTPLANQLITVSPPRRPAFIFMMTEQLPNPNLPEWVRYWAGFLRSCAERLAFSETFPGKWLLKPTLKWVTSGACRFRYYGDLYWLQRQSILTLLVVSSQWTADYLRIRGFDPIGPCFSYDSEMVKDLQLKRDISVLWIGKIATRRRRRLLNKIEVELKKRGVELLMIDGERNDYVFGEARKILLDRTKIVLNLLRAPWDDNSLRYVLAASSRSLIVSEPTLPHSPFLPGKHLIEAPVEQIADSICYYLTHEQERQQIVERAYKLMTSVSIETVMAQLLTRAVNTHQKTILTGATRL